MLLREVVTLPFSLSASVHLFVPFPAEFGRFDVAVLRRPRLRHHLTRPRPRHLRHPYLLLYPDFPQHLDVVGVCLG